MAANIGMMDGAYFVGRGEILSWINNTLALNLQKVEEVRRIPLKYASWTSFVGRSNSIAEHASNGWFGAHWSLSLHRFHRLPMVL